MSKIRKLTESDVVRIFREEWEAKMRKMSEGPDIDFSMKLPGKNSQESILISRGTKVKHKETGIRYTVTNVNEDGCTLKGPEGKKNTVNVKQLEGEYALE
jgi:hypothetical protein